MGDRTYFQLHVVACPRAQRDALAEAIAGLDELDLSIEHPWSPAASVDRIRHELDELPVANALFPSKATSDAVAAVREAVFAAREAAKEATKK